jgi:hypothetical protein
MILVWQRLGCLGFIIPVVVIVLCGMASSAVGGDDPETAAMVKKGGVVGCFFFAALVTGVLGFVLNRKNRTLVADPVSGDPVVVEEGGGHTLFWIPMQYWAIAWAALGVVWMFTK